MFTLQPYTITKTHRFNAKKKYPHYWANEQKPNDLLYKLKILSITMSKMAKRKLSINCKLTLLFCRMFVGRGWSWWLFSSFCLRIVWIHTYLQRCFLFPLFICCFLLLVFVFVYFSLTYSVFYIFTYRCIGVLVFFSFHFKWFFVLECYK